MQGHRDVCGRRVEPRAAASACWTNQELEDREVAPATLADYAFSSTFLRIRSLRSRRRSRPRPCRRRRRTSLSLDPCRRARAPASRCSRRALLRSTTRGDERDRQPSDPVSLAQHLSTPAAATPRSALRQQPRSTPTRSRPDSLMPPTAGEALFRARAASRAR